MERFAAFESKWVESLSRGAKVHFVYGRPDSEQYTHAAIADQFIESCGFSPIGFNWELLDADGGRDEPRSAIGEIAKALGGQLSNPGKTWLDDETASACAQEFLTLFDPANRTIVSNRYDGLWNPIAGGQVEWGFVGFDGDGIALLLLVER